MGSPMHNDARPRLAILWLVALPLACLMHIGCSTESRTDRSAQDIKAALRIPSAPERAQALVNIFSALPAAEAEATLAVYADYRMFVDPIGAVLLADWWANHDPEAAFEALQNETYGGGSLAVEAVIRNWVQRSPRDTAHALANMRSESARINECYRALANGWYEAGLPGLWEFVMQLERGIPRQRLVTGLLVRMVEDEGIEQTLEFVENAPDPGHRFKEHLFHRAAAVVAARDLQRAIDWADSLGDHRHAGSLGRIIGTVYVRENPQEAMEWLVSRPQGEWGHIAVRETFKLWDQRDPERAGAWIEGVERTANHGPAFSEYIIRLVEDDAEKALDLLALVQSAPLRERTTVTMARRWHKLDPPAARAWIDSLPDDVIAAIKGPPLEQRRMPRTPRAAPGPEPAA